MEVAVARADEAARLANVMVARRAESRMRVTGALLVAALCGSSATWTVTAIWFAIFAMLELVERLAFPATRTARIIASARLRTCALGLLLIQNIVLGGFGLAMVAYGYPLGLGLAMGHLGALVMIAVIASQGSRNAFLAAAAPLGVCLIFGAPAILVASNRAPWAQGLAFAICGALILAVGAHLRQAYSALLTSEGEARRGAQAASAAKSAFIATVSHELRTPISAIQAGALELERVSQDVGPRRHAALIVDAGRMMRTLLDDLLDLSKVEAGRMSVEAIAFDVRSVVSDTLRFWQAEARKKGLRLTLSGARRLPQWVSGDPTRLRQVFNNLLSNAIKFTDEGAIAFRISVDGQIVAFSVEDSGPGLTPEQMQRLFAPFAQAEASVARTHGGTGLGLALSRDLARLMGGDLSVASQIGNGARFTIALPLAHAEPQSIRAPEAATQRPGLPALRVLAVDDHEINRRTMALVLQPMGVEASFAADGASALELLSQQAFDVVLLDVHMPDMDGLEVARRLRRSRGLNATTPIVAVTGATEDNDRARCLRAGMNACVGKPIEPAELYAALDAVTTQTDTQDEAGRVCADAAAA